MHVLYTAYKYESICECCVVNSIFLVGGLGEHGLLPEVGGQETVGLRNSGIGRLGEVTQSPGGATGRGVAILDTGHLQQLLGHRGGNNTGTTGGGDQTHPDGAALAGHLLNKMNL